MKNFFYSRDGASKGAALLIIMTCTFGGALLGASELIVRSIHGELLNSSHIVQGSLVPRGDNMLLEYGKTGEKIAPLRPSVFVEVRADRSQHQAIGRQD